MIDDKSVKITKLEQTTIHRSYGMKAFFFLCPVSGMKMSDFEKQQYRAYLATGPLFQLGLHYTIYEEIQN